MIDWERTKKETGFGEDYFKKFPGSNRKVLRICDECPDEKWTEYYNYQHDLCRSCSQIKRWSNPSEREKIREMHIKRFEDPLEHEKLSEAIIKRFKDPLEREKLSIAQIKRHNENPVSDITKKKISEINKKYFEENPVSDITREKMSKAQIKRFEDPEQRILQSCRLLNISRCEWDGFGSVYCELWCEELREYIRDKYGRICFICGKTEEENGRKHDVHHVDYNKNCGCDEAECILVPLCRSCHGCTTFGDREMWGELIIDMLENID